MKTNKILWDVDTQNDLVLKGGEFAVPQAHLMTKNFKKAINHFEAKGYPIMGIVDAHVARENVLGTRDENLPLHCIKGTYGQLKISETQGNILFVSDQKYSEEAIDLIVKNIKSGYRVYFEKQQQCQTSNPNIKTVLKKLGVEEIYFIGLLTNVCIRFADKDFKKMNIKTYLVDGAVKGNDFPDSIEESVINEMLSEGTKYYKI